MKKLDLLTMFNIIFGHVIMKILQIGNQSMTGIGSFMLVGCFRKSSGRPATYDAQVELVRETVVDTPRGYDIVSRRNGFLMAAHV